MRPSHLTFLPFLPGVFFAALCLCLCLTPPYAQARTTMMNSVDAAFAYNPDLKASQENRQISLHAVDRAKAGYLPTVTGFAGGGYSMRSDPTTRSYGEKDDFRAIADAGVRLVQPLWHGGFISADVAASKARHESADMLLEDRGAALAFDAIAAHTEVVRRQDLLALAKNNVKEHSRILNTVSERFTSGVATVGELNQIQSRHARAKATLSAYESALDAAIANYLRVTGRRPLDLLPAESARRAFKNPEEIRAVCLESNARLKAALADVRAALSERDQAKSRFFPQFDFQAGPTWSDRESDASLHTAEFAGEVRMNWEFFSGGADTANVAMSSARIRQARQMLHGLMDALNEDIEATFSRYQSAASQALDYAQAKKASRTAREDYYRQFIQAQRSLIDVLDAENDFFYAASQEVLSKSDRLIAAYRLLALSGVLLDELRISPASLRVTAPTTPDSFAPASFGFPGPLEENARSAARPGNQARTKQ